MRKFITDRFACPNCATEGSLNMGADANWYCSTCGDVVPDARFHAKDGDVFYHHEGMNLPLLKDYVAYSTVGQNNYGESTVDSRTYVWDDNLPGWRIVDESWATDTGSKDDGTWEVGTVILDFFIE